MSAGRRLYVYYRVPAHGLSQVQAAVGAWQRELSARHPGLQAELLRRPETQDGRCTLMEVYAREGDGGVDAALQAGIDAEARQRLGALGLGMDISERHVEVFVPCAS